MKKKKTK